jgi:hypothetical protein
VSGQPKFDLFPESDRKFFLKVVDAQITFNGDSLTLHQNGADTIAKRLSGAELQGAADRLEDIAKRFKAQTQSPGTDAALRRSIAELQAGEPKYDLMTPQFAELTRPQVERLKTGVAQMGAVQSVTFKGVGSGGADIYEVVFEHAKSEWRIMLDSAGRTERLSFQAQ